MIEKKTHGLNGLIREVLGETCKGGMIVSDFNIIPSKYP